MGMDLRNYLPTPVSLKLTIIYMSFREGVNYFNVFYDNT